MNGKQRNVDKEFILYFVVSNENAAWYIKRNAEQFAGPSYKFGNVNIAGAGCKKGGWRVIHRLVIFLSSLELLIYWHKPD